MSNDEIIKLRHLLTKARDTLDKKGAWPKAANQFNITLGFLVIKEVCNTLREE